MIERPGKIVAIGLNYMDHVRESGMPSRRPSRSCSRSSRRRVIGDGEEIRIPRELTERVDWEVELAVVIDREARNVSEADALVLRPRLHGRQRRLGARPAVRRRAVGAGEEPGHVLPARLRAGRRSTTRRTSSSTTHVNGELVQDSNTSEMIFGVAELISFCSHSFTLEPGDVILTGTPWGCRRVHGPEALAARTATWSSARSRASACCATRWWRSDEGPSPAIGRGGRRACSARAC